VVRHVLIHEIGHHFGLSDAEYGADREFALATSLKRGPRIDSARGPSLGSPRHTPCTHSSVEGWPSG